MWWEIDITYNKPPSKAIKVMEHNSMTRSTKFISWHRFIDNNGMNSGFATDNEKEMKVEMNVKLRMEEMQSWGDDFEMANVDNWMVSHSESKNDLTQKLG